MGRKGEADKTAEARAEVEALSGRRRGSKTSKLEAKLEMMETQVIPQTAEEMRKVKAQRDNLEGEGTLATFLSAVRHLFAGEIRRRYEKPDCPFDILAELHTLRGCKRNWKRLPDSIPDFLNR
jgi:hypothetical protein